MYDPQIGRWHVTDPASENGHYNYTPYAYVYNNPLLLVDPFGFDSSFYNANGNMICQETGDQGKTDNNYVVKTTSTTDEMYGENNYFDKGKTNPITEEEAQNTENEINSGNLSGDHMNNLVKLKSTQVMGKMISSIKDDGTGGESDANNTEYGGNFSSSGVKDITHGKVTDPSKGQSASISSTKGINYHSHPSGDKRFMIDGERYHAAWNQPPGARDINSAQGKEYVVGMGSGIIYVYNKSGVVATIPKTVFEK